MQRGLVGSALACCKADPSSTLGSALSRQLWRNGDGHQRMFMNEGCMIVWMYLLYCIKKNKCKKSGIRPPNLSKLLFTYPYASINGVQTTGKVFSPQKRTYRYGTALQNMKLKFLNLFLFLCVIFALLDPDPDYESESRSTDLIESESDSDPDPIPWRKTNAKASRLR